MAVRSLQTEISVGFADDFSMLLGRLDYAENEIGMHFGRRFFLMDWQSKHNVDARQVHIQKGQRAVSGMTQPPGICLSAVSESDQILLADALIIEDAADGVGYEVSDTELLHLGTSVVVGDAIGEYQLLQVGAGFHVDLGYAADLGKGAVFVEEFLGVFHDVSLQQQRSNKIILCIL